MQSSFDISTFVSGQSGLRLTEDDLGEWIELPLPDGRRELLHVLAAQLAQVPAILARIQEGIVSQIQRAALLLRADQEAARLPEFVRSGCTADGRPALSFIQDGALPLSILREVHGVKLSLLEVLQLVLRLAVALKRLHGESLVHGALNSGSVWLNRGQEPWLFGMGSGILPALYAEATGGDWTPAAHRTPYLAPELRGTRALASPAGDIYALGWLMKELLLTTSRSAQTPVTISELIESMCDPRPAARPMIEKVITMLRLQLRSGAGESVQSSVGEGTARMQGTWDDLMRQFFSGVLIGDKYRIVRKLSSGGMGVVFEAINEASGGRVVIKVPCSDLGISTPPGEPNPMNERIRQEVQAAIRAGSHHPGIVRMIDCVQLGGDTPCIVMEFLEGDLLSDRLKARGGKLPVEDAVLIVRQIASALAAAHEVSVIHRDLKPSNVMIVRDPDIAGGERAKVFDFGIAKVASTSRQQARLTQVGWYMGTRNYSAPEQLSDSASVDGMADVYSLGAVFYELLGGKLPLRLPLAKLAPPRVMSLLAQMTTPDPAQRPTMAVVAAALSPRPRWLTSVGLGWTLFASLIFVLGLVCFWSVMPGLPHRWAWAQQHTDPPAEPPASTDRGAAEEEKISFDLEAAHPDMTVLPDLVVPIKAPDMSQPTPVDAGRTEPPPPPEPPRPECPRVTAGCLSFAWGDAPPTGTRQLRQDLAQALTQDVRYRLCPDKRIVLLNRGGTLMIEEKASELDPRVRSVVNLSLYGVSNRTGAALPGKVIVRCKPR